MVLAVLDEKALALTYYFEMTLVRDGDRNDARETKEVRLLMFAETAALLRSARPARAAALVEMPCASRP